MFALFIDLAIGLFYGFKDLAIAMFALVHRSAIGQLQQNHEARSSWSSRALLALVQRL